MDKNDNMYINSHGKKVPRVTHILDMLSNKFLISWANSIGLKGNRYNSVTNRAMAIGTEVHSNIEAHLQGIELPGFTYPESKLSYDAFLKWFDIISQRKYNIVYLEHTIVGESYGGTLDMLIEIMDNNCMKKYLVDFKTSSGIYQNYILQLAAYKTLLFQEENIDIDGCIILRLDKKTGEFEEFLIDLSNEKDLEMIINSQMFFDSLAKLYNSKIRESIDEFIKMKVNKGL